MAFDGILTAAVVKELNENLLYGSIAKVAQPAKDELLLTIKSSRGRFLLMISVNASAPIVSLRNDTLPSPETAPNFCMSLRKHIGGGRITAVTQPPSDLKAVGGGLERVIFLKIAHTDELGDESVRYLVAELMGKHSNIILLKDDLTIIDSIRHISNMTSSVREVLPGREYFIPDAMKKMNPLPVSNDETGFERLLRGGPAGQNIYKKIYMTFTGISPVISGEILVRAGISPDKTAGDLGAAEMSALFGEFRSLMEDVSGGNFSPNIVFEGTHACELSAVRLKSLEGEGYSAVGYDSVSAAIMDFYSEKEKKERLKSKSEDIRAVLRIQTDRAVRKLGLLEKQYEDTEGRDRYRLWGELINVYGYSLSGGEKYLECENYYDDNKLVRIPLDAGLSAAENSVKYFAKYAKLKRMREAATKQIEECRKNIFYLRSVLNSLDFAETEADIDDIRREITEAGFLKSHPARKNRVRREGKSLPIHFVSSDGIDIYVGRNNYQNEEITFHLADADDWWFHAKNIPGSHVIARTGKAALPDKTCLEAAALAAYYSSAGRTCGEHTKIEVDYVKKRELKRVPGAAKGFVIYHTNYSIMIEPRASVC